MRLCWKSCSVIIYNHCEVLTSLHVNNHSDDFVNIEACEQKFFKNEYLST